ncbi:NHLP family bacteriocin export ABC transporter peptidase/permease/ATPase subunit [uncultured Ruminococcus sp.]|uniref:NHLP family bacteriocin export ABC transporter peptidase/permease/ATPase subunit n=1 Tax=uncultured Ruminococcus sp. TaxID=165186 RepID=UPI0025D0F199|nr:NHLP family bacteriocin export ABC transporter peptidase/permease/ATPase subunit [uncultured Ruminococcus sp.]
MSKKKIKPTLTKGAAKVPVIMQLEALECGAASLAMILAYYDKWIPLEQVRSDCGVSRDGSNAKNIAKAARAYGFKVQAYSRTTDSIREKGRFPCIIHWNFNHFVVLDGFKGKYAYINDPARGAVKVGPEEFDKSFTGVTLNFTPTDDFVPEGKRRSTLDFAKKRLMGAGAAVAFVMLTTVITSLFGVLNPIMSKIFMDRLLTGKNPDWLMPFIGVMCGLAAVQLITAWAQTIYNLKINGKMSVVGSTAFMWKILHMPMEFFSQRMAGDIQSRQLTNASIAGTLVNTFAPLLLNTVMMVFYLILMLRQSAALTAIGISTLVLNIVISRIISEKRVNITRVMQRDEAKLSSTTVTGIEMIETIKASGAENGFFQKWAGYQASVNSQTVKIYRMNNYLGMIPTFLSSVANYAVLVMGVYYVMNGRFTLGSLQMFQGMLGSFMLPAMTLISSGQTIQEMRTDMERVEDVMQYPIDPNSTDRASEDEKLKKLRGNVELKNITFGYSKLAEPLISDFSMTIKPGGRVAFVGTSGCGKSTLSKLISGLYEPWSGEILFDGKSRAEHARSGMTGSLAVVDQEITLFEGTVADNIKMWDESIKDFEMILAARDAQLHTDIMEREGGYDSKLTSGGRDLSGGQRQRMEIARVLAQDPSIIILDEATSALDAKTEFEVVKAIKDRGITCIVIAHRLSTIRDCDEIIVMDNGRVVERGTHSELMALGGAYTELVSNE